MISDLKHSLVYGTWVIFKGNGKGPRGKTYRWHVLQHGKPLARSPLGAIRWAASWRCYAFFPTKDTIYEHICLREIADFCEARTKEHKRG
jgi:hypothetical protein